MSGLLPIELCFSICVLCLPVLTLKSLWFAGPLPTISTLFSGHEKVSLLCHSNLGSRKSSLKRPSWEMPSWGEKSGLENWRRKIVPFVPLSGKAGSRLHPLEAWREHWSEASNLDWSPRNVEGKGRGTRGYFLRVRKAWGKILRISKYVHDCRLWKELVENET